VSEDLVVTLADPDLADALTDPARLGPVPDGVRLRVWDLGAPLEDPAEISVVVPPYLGPPDWGPRLAELPGLRLVQTLTAGYDGVLDLLPPGVALAHAVGVHDTSTAELAVALAVGSLRGVPEAVRAAADGAWQPAQHRSLADRRVLVVGFGGVGRAVARRLLAFEAHVTAVASRARSDAELGLPVHAIDDLAGLLADHDVVILTVPLTDATRHLVDAAFLAALPDGALVVNVARGAVVDTAALVTEVASGRLTAALDVTDPEPLPPEHPLWRLPGALVTPHVGGATSAFAPRAARMLADLLQRLSTGRRPRGIVVPSTWSDERDD
jgi:phosphoglycerate dehydrogenase-like enzyme